MLHSRTKFTTHPLAKLYDGRVSFESLIWSGWLSIPDRGSRIVHFVVYPQYRTSAILIFGQIYEHLKIASFVWGLYEARVYGKIQYK